MAEVAEEDGVVAQAVRRSARTTWSRRRAASSRGRADGVLDPEPMWPSRSRADRCDQRVVGVGDHRGSGRQAGRPRRASARRSAPARRSGRAGRGTGCRAPASAAAASAHTPVSAASSTSNSPSSAGRRPRSSAEATPGVEVGAGGVAAQRAGEARARTAAILAVVVLPFVAETHGRARAAARPAAAIASGASRSSSLPGSVVPPPRPVRRDVDAASLAPAPTLARTAITLDGAGRAGAPRRSRPAAPAGRLHASCSASA